MRPVQYKLKHTQRDLDRVGRALEKCYLFADPEAWEILAEYLDSYPLVERHEDRCPTCIKNNEAFFDAVDADRDLEDVPQCETAAQLRVATKLAERVRDSLRKRFTAFEISCGLDPYYMTSDCWGVDVTDV